MSVDYVYYFCDSNTKAFVSKEALEDYRDEYLANQIKLLKEDFEKMKSTVQEHLSPIVNALESHRDFIRLHQITSEERESLNYQFINELSKAIYDESMFKKRLKKFDFFLYTYAKICYNRIVINK